MEWDQWLKEYGEYLAPHWQVEFDLLQESGEPPPQVRFIICLEVEDVKFYYNPTGTRTYYDDWKWSPSQAKIYTTLANAKKSRAKHSQEIIGKKHLGVLKYVPCFTIPLIKQEFK